MSSVFVFDPTVADSVSKARGVGRYLQILQHAFADTFTFTDSLTTIPHDAVFINPFFDPLKTPLTMKRVARLQIAVIHDLIPLKYPSHFPIGMRARLNMFLNSRALKQYDIIVTDSEASKQDIVKILGMSQERIHVVYPALLNQTEGKISKAPLDAPYWLYVGDATWNKNLVNMARAVKKAGVTCVCVGKVFQNVENLTHPWQQELTAFVQETKNDSHFIFPGFVEDSVLAAYYTHAVANILVSRDEGFGFSVLEAGLYGTPSVLGDVAIFHETAQDTALFANPESPDDIVTKITTLMNDSTLRTELGKKALDNTKRFQLESFKKQWLHLTSGVSP